MFKEMGQLAGMMGQVPRIREEMEKLQQRLPQLTAPKATPAPAWSRFALMAGLT